MSAYDPNDPLAGATHCPHCGGLAKVSPHAELRFVCNICGAPRIETKGLPLSGREKPALEAARMHGRHRLFWKIGAIFGFTSAAFVLGVTMIALLLGGGSWGMLGGIVFGLPWVVLAILSMSRAGAKTQELKQALDEAWRTAARDVAMASKDGITGADLARQMGLDATTAENLVAELSIDDAMRARMTDDGRIVVAPLEGLRIDTSASASTPSALDPLEEKFAALEAAEAEAAEAEKKRTL
jgi:hypothetical protein